MIPWPADVRRLARCSLSYTNNETRYCTNRTCFLIRGRCECTWRLGACSTHLAGIVCAASSRMKADHGRSNGAVIVAAVEPESSTGGA
jgi:hypothetical protein